MLFHQWRQYTNHWILILTSSNPSVRDELMFSLKYGGIPFFARGFGWIIRTKSFRNSFYYLRWSYFSVCNIKHRILKLPCIPWQHRMWRNVKIRESNRVCRDAYLHFIPCRCSRYPGRLKSQGSRKHCAAQCKLYTHEHIGKYSISRAPAVFHRRNCTRAIYITCTHASSLVALCHHGPRRVSRLATQERTATRNCGSSSLGDRGLGNFAWAWHI